MYRLMKTCLGVACLVMAAAQFCVLHAEEAAHPQGRDVRRIETDQRRVDERRNEEKRDGTEAGYRNALEGKDLTNIRRSETPSPEDLLKESVHRVEKTNSDENKRQTDYDAYKAREKENPPEGLDGRKRVEWQLSHAEDVRRMRQDWDNKYSPGRHDEDIRNLSNRITNLRKNLDKITE